MPFTVTKRTIGTIVLIGVACALVAVSVIAWVQMTDTPNTSSPTTSPTITPSSVSPTTIVSPRTVKPVAQPTCTENSIAVSADEALANPSAICLLIIRDQQTLNALAPRFSEFSNLQHLNVADSGITSLPTEIGNLSQLAILELNNNQLTQLPDSIKNLAQLTLINVRNNPLAPEAITHLQQITSAQIAN